MLLDCACGGRYTAPDDTPPARRLCRKCGGPLRVVEPVRLDTPVPAKVDVKVLIEQKKALRDELRVRDRQLRQQSVEIAALKAEIARLKSAEPRSKETTVRIATLTSAGALQLPDDRVPLFP